MAIALVPLFLRAPSTMSTGFHCLLLGSLPRLVFSRRNERLLSGHQCVQVRTVTNVSVREYSPCIPGEEDHAEVDLIGESWFRPN